MRGLHPDFNANAYRAAAAKKIGMISQVAHATADTGDATSDRRKMMHRICWQMRETRLQELPGPRVRSS